MEETLLLDESIYTLIFGFISSVPSYYYFFFAFSFVPLARTSCSSLWLRLPNPNLNQCHALITQVFLLDKKRVLFPLNKSSPLLLWAVIAAQRQHVTPARTTRFPKQKGPSLSHFANLVLPEEFEITNLRSPFSIFTL